jgi:aspartate-semialdehyde dehydrogenase
MKVAVVGATGLVGSKMLQVLAERNFPVTELLPVASERSIGKEVKYSGKNYKVVSAASAIDSKPAVALFSAGGATSLEWAPKFAAAGITVIDNSSAWRMDKTKKLVVPENQCRRADKRRQNHRKSELLHHPNGGCSESPAQEIQNKTDRCVNLSKRYRYGRKSA